MGPPQAVHRPAVLRAAYLFRESAFLRSGQPAGLVDDRAWSAARLAVMDRSAAPCAAAGGPPLGILLSLRRLGAFHGMAYMWFPPRQGSPCRSGCTGGPRAVLSGASCSRCGRCAVSPRRWRPPYRATRFLAGAVSRPVGLAPFIEARLAGPPAGRCRRGSASDAQTGMVPPIGLPAGAPAFGRSCTGGIPEWLSFRSQPRVAAPGQHGSALPRKVRTDCAQARAVGLRTAGIGPWQCASRCAGGSARGRAPCAGLNRGRPSAAPGWRWKRTADARTAAVRRDVRRSAPVSPSAGGPRTSPGFSSPRAGPRSHAASPPWR